jgi:hypothetical protein
MIKKYITFIKEEADSSLYDQFDDYEDEEDLSDEDLSDEEGDEEDEEIKNLIYWIRTLYSNSDIEVEIEVEKLDITIICSMDKKTSLKEIIKILDVTKKLSKDILPQYSSKMSMFDTNKGENLIIFEFFYDEYQDIKLPFG